MNLTLVKPHRQDEHTTTTTAATTTKAKKIGLFPKNQRTKISKMLGSIRCEKPVAITTRKLEQ